MKTSSQAGRPRCAYNRTKKGFATEDWLILVAYVLFCGYEGIFLAGLITSGGSLLEIDLAGYQNFLKYAYGIEIVFTITITLVKLSILFLYCTIFPTKPFKRASAVVGMLCLAWAVIVLFISIFQCRPVAAAWNLSLLEKGAQCLLYGRYILGYELSNMFLDITILCLPITMIRRLQLPRVKKIMVGGMFAMGGFIVIICIVRVIYLHDLNISNPDDLENGMNWSNIELAVAIVCACLPTYGPFLKHLAMLSSGIKHWYGSVRYHKSRALSSEESFRMNGSDNATGYVNLDRHGDQQMPLTKITGGSSVRGLAGAQKDSPPNAISVQQSMEVV